MYTKSQMNHALKTAGRLPEKSLNRRLWPSTTKKIR